MTKIWEQGNENVVYTVISPSSNLGWVYYTWPRSKRKLVSNLNPAWKVVPFFKALIPVWFFCENLILDQKNLNDKTYMLFSMKVNVAVAERRIGKFACRELAEPQIYKKSMFAKKWKKFP